MKSARQQDEAYLCLSGQESTDARAIAYGIAKICEELRAIRVAVELLADLAE